MIILISKETYFKITVSFYFLPNILPVPYNTLQQYQGVIAMHGFISYSFFLILLSLIHLSDKNAVLNILGDMINYFLSGEFWLYFKLKYS